MDHGPGRGGSPRPRASGLPRWHLGSRLRETADGCCRWAHRCGRDRGSATAELAIGLLSLTVVLGCMMWGLGLVQAQTRCADAAREGARAAARGESEAAVHVMVSSMVPPSARISLAHGIAAGVNTVEVTVQVPVPAAPWLGLGRFPPIASTAVSVLEGP